jgi:hypothetical protein
MYRKVFPRCTVLGPVDPIPFSHMVSSGAVPRKCQSCKHLFEGSCTRATEQVEGYLALDHGPCPVKGATHPVLVESQYFVTKVYVPAKCKTCTHLDFSPVKGFFCGLDAEKWGHFPRTLDWSSWSPEFPNVGLKSGRSVTVQLLQAVRERNEAGAIKLFRETYADASFKEAREAYAELVVKLHQYGS